MARGPLVLTRILCPSYGNFNVRAAVGQCRFLEGRNPNPHDREGAGGGGLGAREQFRRAHLDHAWTQTRKLPNSTLLTSRLLCPLIASQLPIDIHYGHCMVYIYFSMKKNSHRLCGYVSIMFREFSCSSVSCSTFFLRFPTLY